MLGIGTPEILLILALAVIVVGPKKLPELASSLGKIFADLKKSMDTLKESASVDFKTELEKADLLKKYPNLAEYEARQAAAAKVEESPQPGEPLPAQDSPSQEAQGAIPPAQDEADLPTHAPEET